MRHWKTTLAAVAMSAVLAVAALAQAGSNVTGSVENDNGAPWQNVGVTLQSSKSGSTPLTTKTDAKGNFSFENVPPGDYTITFDTDEYPPQKYPVHLTAGTPINRDMNFQKLIAQNPKLAAQLRAQKEFQALKVHFDAGVQALNQGNTLRQQLASEPAAQKTATQQQIAQLSQTAVSSFEAAAKAASPTNANLPIILGNLGSAYELAGKHAEAADAFTKASQLKPTDPSLLLGAATNLAYAGKLDEASADCAKAAALPPQSGAKPQSGGSCWRNIGVVLYNTSQMKQAIVPLQKATQADPSDADTWYLLGEALMNAMQSKMVNGKLTAIVQPGTVEAFQKYMQLAPTGPHAPEVKQALQVLQQLGAGVNSKFVAPEPEKKH